jgi:hypothetical protein
MSKTSAYPNEQDHNFRGATGGSSWFAAMEYFGLILNRTYKVFVTDQMVSGAKVSGLVSSPRVVEPSMFDEGFWVRTPAARQYDHLDVTSQEFLGLDPANFQMRWHDIAKIEYRPGKKWGMGNVPYSGRLTLQHKAGRPRELILLGKQDGDALKARLGRLLVVDCDAS